MQTAITCGVAGWSYPDWKGFVYPPGLRDPLPFLAGYVDLIEINSTFYRPADPKYAARWAACAAGLPGFYFTAKLHRDITHEFRLEPAAADQFKRGLDPLLQAGLLRHLLAQFRYDFDITPAHCDLLERIQSTFGGLTTLTLELRHKSWESAEAGAFLAGLGVSVANLDYPTGSQSYTRPISGIGRHAYLRLHGRNRAAWFDREAGRDETYNYLYSAEEVTGLVERARSIAASSATLTVVANNHYQGKEVVNALQFKAMLTGAKVKVPTLLRSRYPELDCISAPE